MEWLVVAVLVGVFAVVNFWPGWRILNSDFPNHYLAAQLYRRGISLDRAYEWTWFQRANDHLEVRDGLVGFAPNPPMSILPLVPLGMLRPLTAKRVWLICNLLFLAFSLFALHRVTSLNWRRLCLITLLCVLPLHIEFVYARHYLLILALISAAYAAFRAGRQRSSGILLGVAGAMKLFPLVFAILFIWKRNWRALGGLVVGAASITMASLGMFGFEMHRVFLQQVLSQAPRCDWLGPYILAQNSFITLWSHAFLFEPELNPSPLLNSPLLYAVMQAVTVTVLVFAFLSALDGEDSPSRAAMQWAGLVPLCLLLSTTTGADHPCLLIFSGIVGVDVLLTRDKSRALLYLLLYVVACAWLPYRISSWIPLYRLVGMTALYALSLREGWKGSRPRFQRYWLAAGLLSVVALTAYNLRFVRNREEDFIRRLPGPQEGHRSANPVPFSDGVAFTEMQRNSYQTVLFKKESLQAVPSSADVLSISGAPASNRLYFEFAGRRSLIHRFSTETLTAASEPFVEGHDPALSANGKWLAFVSEQQGRSTAWLAATDSGESPRMVLPPAYRPLDVSVTSEGDMFAAVGGPGDPRLVRIERGAQQVETLSGFPHPARYPAISPDGERLAFTRLDHGSWHLVVREISNGNEQQLTHAWCNAASPSWQDTHTLLYASDCGRGVGLSAIVRRTVP